MNIQQKIVFFSVIILLCLSILNPPKIYELPPGHQGIKAINEAEFQRYLRAVGKPRIVWHSVVARIYIIVIIGWTLSTLLGKDQY